MAGMTKQNGRRRLASREVTLTMLVTEPPLASYLAPLWQVGFLLPTVKLPKLKEKESIGGLRCREGGLSFVLKADRDSMRMTRKSGLAALHFLF
jgi:hypothetical protein